MRFRVSAPAAVVLLLILATCSNTGRVLAQKICPDPDEPCGSFKSHDLPFTVSRSNAAGAEDRSDLFYAVILRTAPRCSIAESERTPAQQLFPRNKVFVSRFECDAEDNVNYTTIDSKYSVLAVYAAATLPKARAFLDQVQKTGRFSGAYIRRMRAVLVHP